jgi:hypothetical protein
LEEAAVVKWRYFPVIILEDREKHERASMRLGAVPPEIRIMNLPRTSPERYRYAMPPVDKTQIKKERNIKLSIYVNQL